VTWLEERSGEDFCYVTTTGRRTGRPHTIEIWFGARGDTLYLLSGGGDGADWLRNLRADPGVRVRIGDETTSGTARLVEDPEEDLLARRLLPEKYAPRYRGSLDRWARTAIPVAIDLDR
jgi:deazaflavin-dependent oxidoreductase (nitroreductase family)